MRIRISSLKLRRWWVSLSLIELITAEPCRILVELLWTSHICTWWSWTRHIGSGAAIPILVRHRILRHLGIGSCCLRGMRWWIVLLTWLKSRWTSLVHLWSTWCSRLTSWRWMKPLRRLFIFFCWLLIRIRLLPWHSWLIVHLLLLLSVLLVGKRILIVNL